MKDPSDEEILDTLYSFIEANTPLQAKQIVQVQRDLLLTRRADELLAQIADKNKNSSFFPLLIEKREFLTNCRLQGIDAAYAPYAISDNLDIPAEILDQLTSLGSWEEFEHFMHEHPELDPVAAKFLSHQITQVAKAKGMIDASLSDIRLKAIGLELDGLTSLKDTPRQIELLQEAVSLVAQESDPGLWAYLKTELGKSIVLNPGSRGSEETKEATQHFQEALEVLSEEELSGTYQWAVTLTMLGNAYEDDFAEGDRATNFEKAIKCYEKALNSVALFEEHPEDWGLAQVYLAEAYVKQPRSDYESAIRHYQEALRVYTRDKLPDKWAGVLCEIGQAYTNHTKS